jgi:LysR family transcriptional regulator, hydrogen peroxide-inducible genes activator
MRIVPFAEPQPSRKIGLVWRSSASGRRRDFEALGMAIAESATDLLHN